ncbi:hypothetical protein I3843_03G120200 [Carya illinoinensis]|nr:hypothetical protein I3843_03G120200 [Carya illinoinensis]
MPKIKIDSLYHRTWIQSKMKSLFHVKTLEQTFPISRTQEHCVLFEKKTIKSFQEKGYKFMHIASVQIAVVPLVRKGINACVLLCLCDGRHLNYNNSILGIIQTSIIDGPIHFNCYPDLTVDLFDKNVLSSLTLSVKTSGFDMVEGSRPISLVYRIYYRVLSTSLEPKAKIKSPKNETVLMYSLTSNSNITTPKMLFWKDVTLPNEWVLKQELPPRKYLDGTVKISFDQPSISERRNSFAGSRSSVSSDQDLRDKNLERFLRDRDNPVRPIQIRELHSKEEPLDQDIKLEGISTKSQVTSAYYSTIDYHKSKGKSIKEEVQVEDDVESTSPTASDMVAPVHSSLMVLDKALDDLDSGLLVIDMINLHADFMSKENHDKGKTYHRIYSISEKQKIRKEWKKKMYKENKHILFFDFLENHYVSKKDNSKYLNVLKTSFTKEEGRKVVKTSHPPLETIIVSVKGKEVRASPFKISDPGVNENVFAETKKIIEQNNFVNQTLHTIVQKIDLLEKEFQGLQVEKPELARIYSRDIKPIGLTKNWYSRPTPPDLQYEERGSYSQFSVSADQMYEWNIDGFSEQEILNTLNRMSMVAIAYYNNKLSQIEIVDILTSGFSGMLRSWWDKHLTTEGRETIRSAVKRDTDGLPILPPEEDRREGTQGSPDGVNTLIFTIVKHFVGTPSNITNRVSDYLNNLRCNKMSDYRWYKDVFMSRVMLRDDSQKPYWKEKFIDGLPRLFAIKVKDSLTDITGYLNYDDYTYGDIVSMIQKLGISMCNDQRMIAQQMKDRKKAKYEMGNFCEQFGLPPIAPSVQCRKSSKRFGKPRRNYNRSREEFYKKPISKSVSRKKPFHKKISKTPAKGTCFNCGQPGHYANKCTKKPQGFKKKLNELNINSVDQEDLFRLLEHGSPTSSDDDELSSSGSDYHSDSDHEYENMLLSIISQIQDPELKEKYLKKLKETMTRKEPSTSNGKISFEETLGHLACLKLDKEFDHESPSSDDSNQSDHVEPSNPTKEFCLIHRSVPQKWFCLVEIIVNHEYKFSAVALIDSGVNLNCIREGLVPTSYFEKSEENLFSANGSKMKIRPFNEPLNLLTNFLIFKIVKTDTSDAGYGGILKQVVSPGSSEQIVRFHSRTWNHAQHNYSTIKKEILSVVLCISKFQKNMSKKKKPIPPITSPPPRPVLPMLMPPASASTLASSPLEIANRFTSLGQVPRPIPPSSFVSTLVTPYDAYANPLTTVNPRFPSANKAEYFLKAWFQNLFYIEKSVKTDPFQIASDYFPRGFHWIPEDLNKNLSYYLGILVGTGSILVKPIYCKVDPARVIFHNCFIISVITEEEWETHPSTFKTVKDSNAQYNYYDYIEAWLRFPLFQTPAMQHSWFFNFNKNCKQSFPLWFQKWWHFFGPIDDLFPDSL